MTQMFSKDKDTVNISKFRYNLQQLTDGRRQKKVSFWGLYFNFGIQFVTEP